MSNVEWFYLAMNGLRYPLPFFCLSRVDHLKGETCRFSTEVIHAAGVRVRGQGERTSPAHALRISPGVMNPRLPAEVWKPEPGYLLRCNCS